VATPASPSAPGDPEAVLLPGEGSRAVAAWYPDWAREFTELYLAGTTCVFVIHGNVHDLMQLGDSADAKDRYGSLPEFLGTQLFSTWDIVLRHDLGEGLRIHPGRSSERLRRMINSLTERIGEPKTWPRDPDLILDLLDKLIQRIVMEEDPAKQLRLGIILDHAQYLVPASELSQMVGALGSRMVRLLSWAQNPYIKRRNIAICLLCDRLTELNERLAASAHVATLEVPMPDAQAREAFAGSYDRRDGTLGNLTDFSPKQLAELTSGLNIVNIERLLSHAAHSGRKLDATGLKRLKKGLIEQQARGLVEFVEPPHTLDDFVGNEAVKKRVSEDAVLLTKGRLDAAPMGYLVCGPVGTGKTYLAECLAGSVGIPCVKMRNFRSKYVGETEGNLETLLRVLRAMGPVVVVIDEADAALGTREAGGDSGTSSRVFSMIASQMGDTRYRGKLIWMLLTSRPDLLPIDLKRQGRAEVHLPLFSPRDLDEVRFMIKVMARKNKSAIDDDAVPEKITEKGLSGADIESIVLLAKRHALTEERDRLTRSDLQMALDDFIPSASGLEKEKQELAAVLECTSISFLPDDWRKEVLKPDGRAKIQERMAAINRLLQE
jgi:AAA+ superfamily predicted ATPase